MRRLYLRDCQAGEMVEDIFVLSQKQISTTATGKLFIKAFVGDRTAQQQPHLAFGVDEEVLRHPGGPEVVGGGAVAIAKLRVAESEAVHEGAAVAAEVAAVDP